MMGTKKIKKEVSFFPKKREVLERWLGCGERRAQNGIILLVVGGWRGRGQLLVGCTYGGCRIFQRNLRFLAGTQVLKVESSKISL